MTDYDKFQEELIKYMTDKEKDLFDAIYKNNLEEVNRLIKEGADLNAKNNYGETPIIWAARRGKGELVQALIDAGADVNAKDRLGDTALMWAARGETSETVQALISAGADVNAKTNYGKTALMNAMREGNKEIVRILIDAGFELNAKGNISDHIDAKTWIKETNEKFNIYRDLRKVLSMLIDFDVRLSQFEKENVKLKDKIYTMEETIKAIMEFLKK